MAHAQRPGAKARNRAARNEGLFYHFRPMEQFHTIAERISGYDQFRHAPAGRQRSTSQGHAMPRRFQPGCHGLQRCRIRDFPAKGTEPIMRIGADNHALAPIIHAEGDFGCGFFGEHQAKQTRAEASPIIHLACAQFQIAQCGNGHGAFPFTRPSSCREEQGSARAMAARCFALQSTATPAARAFSTI